MAWSTSAGEQQLPARPLESPLTLGGNTYTRLAPRISGNPDFGHEYLDALDLGWRASWSSRLSTELAAYHYRYDDLRHAHRRIWRLCTCSGRKRQICRVPDQ